MRLVLTALVLVASALPALPANAGTVAAAPSGQWVVDCAYTRSAPDDPIVFPGQPGASHLHDFFGNVSISANSTAATMAGVRSTCAKNDRSAYWAPALYRDGVQIKPTSMNAYYENRFAAGTTVEPFPPGFKMVFGDRTATTAGEVDDHIVWGCGGNTQIGGKEPPAACPTGVIQLRIMWPYCWDGKTAYGKAGANVSFAPGGKCPAAYPHRLPTLRTNMFYPVGTSTGTVRLASGSVYSVHADFLNAWDQPTLTNLVATCLNAFKDCGHFRGTTTGTAGQTRPTATPKPTPSSPGTRKPAPSLSPTTQPAEVVLEDVSAPLAPGERNHLGALLVAVGGTCLLLMAAVLLRYSRRR